MENQYLQKSILELLDYQLRVGVYLRSFSFQQMNGRWMRRLILMVIRKMEWEWRIYLDRQLHVGLLELVRLVELMNVMRLEASG